MEKDFIRLYFENSWWVPQVVLALSIAITLIAPFAFAPRIIKAWRARSTLPQNTLLSITQDGDHWIIYLNKQAPLPLEAITQTTHNYLLEHKPENQD